MTQELLRRAHKEVYDRIDSIILGQIVADTAGRTAMNACTIAGFLEGINFFREFWGDEPERLENQKIEKEEMEAWMKWKQP